MALSKEDVQHIALLSRLNLSPDQLEQFTDELDEIITYARKISSLDTDNVPTTTHAVPVSNIMRDDIPHPSLSNEEALENSPDKEGPCFKVPRLVE